MKNFVKMLDSLTRKLSEEDDKKVINARIEKSESYYTVYIQTDAKKYGVRSNTLKPNELANLELQKMEQTLFDMFGLERV